MLCLCIFNCACKNSNQHLVALEVNLAIFNVVLCPLYKTPLLTCGNVPHTTSLAENDKHSQKVAK